MNLKKIAVVAWMVLAGCAAEDVGAPDEEQIIEESVDVDLILPAAATNCLYVEWCNAPESEWPGVGTVCHRRAGETCNSTQEKAECKRDANAVCGGLKLPYIIYN